MIIERSLRWHGECDRCFSQFPKEEDSEDKMVREMKRVGWIPTKLNRRPTWLCSKCKAEIVNKPRIEMRTEPGLFRKGEF